MPHTRTDGRSRCLQTQSKTIWEFPQNTRFTKLITRCNRSRQTLSIAAKMRPSFSIAPSDSEMNGSNVITRCNRSRQNVITRCNRSRQNVERKRPSLRRQNVLTGKCCNSSIIIYKVGNATNKCLKFRRVNQELQPSTGAAEAQCFHKTHWIPRPKHARSQNGPFSAQNALDTEAQARAVLNRAIQRHPDSATRPLNLRNLDAEPAS